LKLQEFFATLQNRLAYLVYRNCGMEMVYLSYVCGESSLYSYGVVTRALKVQIEIKLTIRLPPNFEWKLYVCCSWWD